MTNSEIYRDIAVRCGGDIYIGVVGPVRTGKSTFIKRFMETVVIPNIPHEHDRTRARDELPQSAGGRTVMTTEPKFIPDEAVQISVGECGQVRVRMIDCVGYIVPDAIGNTENGEMRMVHTPWSADPLPFDEAAEIGTRKVITEHSTIGMLVTADGSFGDIPRQNYVEAEERTAREMHAIGKPFAVILNSANPDSPEAEALAMELEKKYRAPVALLSCLELNAEDIAHILRMVLMEFPIREMQIRVPGWTSALEEEHWLRSAVSEAALKTARSMNRVGDAADSAAEILVRNAEEALRGVSGDAAEGVSAKILSVDLGSGCAVLELSLPDALYYRIIGELSGIRIESERELLHALRSLTEAKKEYDKYAEAIRELDEHGYGIVMPDVDSLTLEEPQIVRQSGGYGVKLRASAPSVHMIRASIETEINPIVGTEAQSEELVKNLLRDFEEDPKQIWESNLFGKSLYELVNDGLHAKLSHMPDDARAKLGETLSRVINEGSGGLICIIL
ncbi:MAG: stage IV sporulation protein A [Ruminococcaceae bacterium]|nr:stage IV sporulation protein A [Oscillospiraceae bacterium]